MAPRKSSSMKKNKNRKNKKGSKMKYSSNSPKNIETEVVQNTEKYEVVAKITPSMDISLTAEQRFELELSQCTAFEQDVIRKAREKGNDLVELANSQNWKRVNRKGNTTAFSMETPGNIASFKGEGVIDFPASEILDFIQ